MKTYDALCDRLESIFDEFEIDPSTCSHVECGELVLAVYPRTGVGSQDQSVADVVVADQLVVAPLLKWLAWGIVLVGSDEPALTGRTDEWGHLVVKLPAGRYRVRFVTNPYSSLDRRVLELVGDAEALAMLDDAPWLVDQEAYSLEFFAVGNVLDYLGWDDTGDDLPAGRNSGLSQNGTRYLLDYPIRLPEFPNAPEFSFGCALVECWESGGRLLARELIPVREHRGRHFGELSARKLFPTDSAPDRVVGSISVDESLLRAMATGDGRTWLQCQLKAMLELSVVRYDEALKTKISSALTFVRSL